MNETEVTAVIERLDYRCAVFSVVDADDVLILLKAYKELKNKLDAVPVAAIRSAFESEVNDCWCDASVLEWLETVVP
jgi:hypothetical protein